MPVPKQEKTTRVLAKEDTLPRLLLRNYHQWGAGQIALRKKELGIWREYTWEDCYRNTKAVFLGLASLGLGAGNGVSILADSSPEWLWCELAVQTARGIVTGLNPGGTAEETKGLMTLGRARIALAQDQEQVDRVLEIRQGLPSLQKVVYWRERGLNRYNDPMLMSLNHLMRQGEEYEKTHPGDFERKLAHGKSDDIAIMIFTLGADDALKVVPASHRFLLSCVDGLLSACPDLDGRSDEYVSVIMPGWFFEQAIGFARCLATGNRLNFPEKPETAPEDFREISPHTLVYPSKVWNEMASTMKTNIRRGAWFKKSLFNWALSEGSQGNEKSMSSSRFRILKRTLDCMGNLLVFRPLKDKHGFGNVRVAYAAGEPLEPETLGFFRAIGVDLREIYGSTKGGITSVRPPEDQRIK